MATKKPARKTTRRKSESEDAGQEIAFAASFPHEPPRFLLPCDSGVLGAEFLVAVGDNEAIARGTLEGNALANDDLKYRKEAECEKKKGCEKYETCEFDSYTILLGCEKFTVETNHLHRSIEKWVCYGAHFYECVCFNRTV